MRKIGIVAVALLWGAATAAAAAGSDPGAADRAAETATERTPPAREAVRSETGQVLSESDARGARVWSVYDAQGVLFEQRGTDGRVIRVPRPGADTRSGR